ncbi:MarR family winged helix-turn-helix transcriptional regulator [Novosphingobium sp. KCTC 2891]|uniref:MarR family winged helix-turn-helix transcriptional regulator n=1 Tax=Novosphingobium sp. KCTC 2891 TaxID=2989730 RepID=UPI002222A096|nr:MarR family winged helix-turn-helix transcriptional regulator [Novosphingobium sp. KCTC 2891]MCW1383003.1 MarR family winged helix-turn-helix transcriptional regulator [Novosphingobium sp. KCTC 2891]
MANVQSRIGDAPAAAPAAEAPHRGATAAELALGTARRVYRDRRRRAELFNGDLFSEPAWDMLLDLYIAACEDRQVSTTSACIGANVPVATGLRWIQLLENEGLIVRNADPSDARRTWISLTASARRSMRRYLGGMAETQTVQAQGAIAA